ncbi:MAG TPA: AmmeMemoRadiSam system radical SAM enzyme [bacterium]|nr:AmmeMemoRadiSam system radical SAM enzyme [bacterium]
MHEAMFYRADGGAAVVCGLCAHRCRIPAGRRGLCRVRENRSGRLEALSYGRLAAAHIDPIEKKPFFHVLPGSAAFSVATVGCNMTCRHCQNASLSQPDPAAPVPGREVAPEAVVAAARDGGCASIAYTYSEPTVFYEYARDIALRARAAGLRNLFVSNGYMSPEAADEASTWLDGANIDLKAFDDDFYREVCGARLAPVLDTIARLKERGVWIEVTTLIIPGYNDDTARLRELARYLAGLDPGLPWHLSAFFPTYRLTDAPPTTPEILRRAREIGREEGLRFVYTGNVPGEEGENTFCPSCGKVLIERLGYRSDPERLRGGVCPDCGEAIPGIWS